MKLWFNYMGWKTGHVLPQKWMIRDIRKHDLDLWWQVPLKSWTLTSIGNIKEVVREELFGLPSSWREKNTRRHHLALPIDGWCQFFLKHFLHIWQCIALYVFFTWLITEIKLALSHLWNEFQDKMVHQKTFAKNGSQSEISTFQTSPNNPQGSHP